MAGVLSGFAERALANSTTPRTHPEFARFPVFPAPAARRTARNGRRRPSGTPEDARRALRRERDRALPRQERALRQVRRVQEEAPVDGGDGGGRAVVAE